MSVETLTRKEHLRLEGAAILLMLASNGYDPLTVIQIMQTPAPDVDASRDIELAEESAQAGYSWDPDGPITVAEVRLEVIRVVQAFLDGKTPEEAARG